MNFKTILLSMGIAVCAFSLHSCKKPSPYGKVDSDQALKFLTEVTSAPEANISADMNLYVDYSTCVAEGLTSPLFQGVQSTIIASKPVYYSIKGNEIKAENGDIYQMMRGIKEVNNANLKGAVDSIVASGKQAMLITDAEYWMPNLSGDNLNNPYMKEGIADWLAEGRDIYIYAEPYVESGKYPKFRYYFVFTDDRLPQADNFNSKLVKAVPSIKDLAHMHLSASGPKVDASSLSLDDMVPNGKDLMLETSVYSDAAKNGIQFLWFDGSLQELADSFIGQKTNRSGESVGDLPFISEIKIPQDASELFKYTDLDLVVYDVLPKINDYINAPTEDENGDPVTVVPKTDYEKIEDLFELNTDDFEDNGMVSIYFDKDCAEYDLKRSNLVRIDIVAKKVEANLEGDDSPAKSLSWTSISKSADGLRNNSLYESVKQAAINDKRIKPEAEGDNVVYTIYVAAQK